MSITPIKNSSAPKEYNAHEWSDYFDYDPEVPMGLMRGVDASCAAMLESLCKMHDIKQSWSQRSKIQALIISVFNDTCEEVGLDPAKAEQLLSPPYTKELLKEPHWSEIGNVVRECEADW